ncbi:MAG TPA: TetR/AcrR family transcriptional regulator [Candidatus Omnitrophota bacterium]|nr:TetR/AcrR family transcriptional regulator [Candidatus Omnitrophota bacterium]HPT06678.1 TetR/AcrR family transcriptional regulator [Candidatus Omnitrophota bacterium]
MQEAVAVDMRKRIIDAAITIAGQSGFSRATTKEIAGEADCSEGIIYHYFTSKNELFLAVIKENAEAFIEQLRAEVSQGTGAYDKLERIIDFHFYYFTGKIHIFQILFGKSADATIPFPYVLKTVLLPYQKIIEQVVIKGMLSEEFYQVNANVIATSLLGMMQINIIKLHFGVKDNSVDEIKNTVKHLIFKTLLRTR